MYSTIQMKPLNRNYFLLSLFLHCAALGNLNSQSPSKLNEDAIQLAEEGDYEKALKKLESAANIAQVSAIAYHNMGYTHHLEGNYDLAIQNYKLSIERNPKLVPPRQNLGEIYYTQHRYKEAIDQAEKVLELDPSNKRVIKWLEDARKKYNEQKILVHHSGSDIGAGVGDLDDVYPLLRSVGWYSLRFDYIIGAGYFVDKGGGPPRTILLPTATRLPMFFIFQLKSFIQVNIRGVTAPIPGVLNPAFFEAEETVEFVYWYQKWFFGAGFMLSQFDMSVDSAIGLEKFRLNTDINSADDFKLGVVWGYSGDVHSFSMTIYPRYLFRDPATSNKRKISVDRNVVSLLYTSKVKSTDARFSPSFLLEFRINESYVTEYQTSLGPIIGHYFGYYDFNVGIIFPNIGRDWAPLPLALGLKLINRIYFADLNDPEPRKFGNGQGFLGFDSDEALLGNTFAGLRSASHKILLLSKQRISKHVSLQETIGFDYHPSSQVSLNVFEMYLQIGLRF